MLFISNINYDGGVFARLVAAPGKPMLIMGAHNNSGALHNLNDVIYIQAEKETLLAMLQKALDVVQETP
jgi:hypothetical protein